MTRCRPLVWNVPPTKKRHNHMSQSTVDNFIDKKNAESPYLTLLDGDAVSIKLLKAVKVVTKVGYSGEEIECLRLVCIAETAITAMTPA